MIETALIFAAALAAAEPSPSGSAAPPDQAREPSEGRAVIECRVIRGGYLRDCVVIEESPPGSGFGAATLKAAKRFKMKPRAADGRPVAGGTVRIPLTWKLDAPPSETTTP